MDHAGEDDVRAAEGVEHLQRAARELLKAARSFLDVVEDVVDDPDRLRGATAGLSDLVATTLGRREAPWERSAWAPADEHPADEHPADEHPADGDTTEDAVATPAEGSVGEADTGVPTTRTGATKRRPSGAGPSSRVRRIAVD